jgi:hypothetical protein
MTPKTKNAAWAARRARRRGWRQSGSGGVTGELSAAREGLFSTHLEQTLLRAAAPRSRLRGGTRHHAAETKRTSLGSPRSP